MWNQKGYYIPLALECQALTKAIEGDNNEFEEY